MATSQRLTRALQQQLGDELSRELLTWMGRMDSSRSELTKLQVAFDEFVVQTNHRFDGIDRRFDAIDAKFERLEGKFDAKFDAKFELLGGRLDSTRLTMEALIEKRHAELLKWAFIFWCGSVFATVALVAAIR